MIKSYEGDGRVVMEPTGIEPATPALQRQCSPN